MNLLGGSHSTESQLPERNLGLPFPALPQNSTHDPPKRKGDAFARSRPFPRLDGLTWLSRLAYFASIDPHARPAGCSPSSLALSPLLLILRLSWRRAWTQAAALVPHPSSVPIFPRPRLAKRPPLSQVATVARAPSEPRGAVEHQRAVEDRLSWIYYKAMGIFSYVLVPCQDGCLDGCLDGLDGRRAHFRRITIRYQYLIKQKSTVPVLKKIPRNLFQKCLFRVSFVSLG